MKKLIIVLVCFILSCSTENKKAIELPPIPDTPVRMVSETLFGKEIQDPYRYLEELEKPKVEQWYKDHSERSRKVLDAISGRSELIDKMHEFDSRKSTRISNLQITDNNQYFYLKLTPQDENGKLFHRDGFEGEETLIFDPEIYDQTSEQNFVISAHYPSPNGNKIAFEVSPNGSESTVLLIMNIESKNLYPERIDRCWFASCSWLPDGNSFLFNRLQSADVHDLNREKNSKSYIHELGQNPENDIEIFSKENNPELDIKEEEFPIMFYDRDSKFIFGISASVDNRIKAWYAPSSELKKSTISWIKLFEREDEVYNFLSTEKEIFVYTPKGAPNHKILKMPIDDPDLDQATEVVPEFSDKSITNLNLNSEGLYFSTTKNGVVANLYRLSLISNEIEEIDLPINAGNINISTRGNRFEDIWVSMRGWTEDNNRYRYSQQEKNFKEENLSSKAEYPEYSDLIVEELMVKSHDGVEVPLSLVYKKDIKNDGTNQVFILGYGAYGYSINPFFSPNLLLWTQQGGIFAVAHVRGGSEMGNEWYKAGFKTTKPNTWKDLIACAEYLVDNQYTSPKKIAINGGSAGGILIGRAMTDRPDLFAVAIPDVGCLNPLRAEESPNGPVNVPEFGTVKDSVECMALMEMDSYLHIKDGGKYPATLITAGMNDPRVIAWQPGKFAARLTAANASENPILFFADFEAGHGIGNSKSKQFESLADAFCFAFWQTGHPSFQISEILSDTELLKEEVKNQ